MTDLLTLETYSQASRLFTGKFVESSAEVAMFMDFDMDIYVDEGPFFCFVFLFSNQKCKQI